MSLSFCLLCYQLFGLTHLILIQMQPAGYRCTTKSFSPPSQSNNLIRALASKFDLKEQFSFFVNSINLVVNTQSTVLALTKAGYPIIDSTWKVDILPRCKCNSTKVEMNIKMMCWYIRRSLFIAAFNFVETCLHPLLFKLSAAYLKFFLFFGFFVALKQSCLHASL